MVTLRLFHQNDPFRQIEARSLETGELSIGRDASADWTIEDPERGLSRLHCVIALQGGAVTLRDISSNGVFVGAGRARPQPGEVVPLIPGETLRLGDFMIIVDKPQAEAKADGKGEPLGFGFDAPFNRPLMKQVAVGPAALAIPSDWEADEVSRAAARGATSTPGDGSLLEAFCAGARLDASTFSGEDPEAVMMRLGAVYQQMVLGLGELMNERTSVRTEYRMVRTTVRAEGNNPFKWAPAQRVAVDLLRPRDDGFLSGPSAVKASFEDLKKHLLCMLAGLRAAVASTVETLSPDKVEDQLKGQSFVLKNRAGAAWAEYLKLYDEFRTQADNNPDSTINRAFRAAYERQLEELDGMGTLP
jgi:predicted component of type VI protein secretion system